MKIAIIGGIHSDGLKLLEKSNFEIFEISNFEESNLINELKDIDGIILRTATVTPDVLKCCNKIKIIARHGVGYDNLDLTYMSQNNIALGITGTSNAVSVAEHVLTCFLYLTKNIYGLLY